MDLGVNLNKKAFFDNGTSQELRIENDHPLSSLGAIDELVSFSPTASNRGSGSIKAPTSTIKVLLVSLGVISILSATFFLVSFLVFQLPFLSSFVIIPLMTLIVSALFFICLLGTHCHSSRHHIAEASDGVLDLYKRKCPPGSPTSLVVEDELRSLEGRGELSEIERTIEEQMPAMITPPDSFLVTQEMMASSALLVENDIQTAVSILEGTVDLLPPVKKLLPEAITKICEDCLINIRVGMPLESFVNRNSALLCFFPHYIYSFKEEKIDIHFRSSISLFLLGARKTKEKYFHLMTVLEQLAKKSTCYILSQKYLELFLVCKHNFSEFHAYQESIFNFHEIDLAPLFRQTPPLIESILSRMESFLLLWDHKKYAQQWSPTAQSYMDFMKIDKSFLGEPQEKHFNGCIKVSLQETALLKKSQEFLHLVRSFIGIICSPVVQARTLSKLKKASISIPALGIVLMPERKLIPTIVPIKAIIAAHQTSCYRYLKNLKDAKEGARDSSQSLREGTSKLPIFYVTALDLHDHLWAYWDALRLFKEAVISMEEVLHSSLSLSNEKRNSTIKVSMDRLSEDGELSILQNNVLSAGCVINENLAAFQSDEAMVSFFAWRTDELEDISQIVTLLQKAVASLKK